jgi:tetratricopeptide (TPR) repeat protein
MDILLKIIPKIPSEYAFPAFALALLMIFSYFIITNKAVLKVIDKSLNGKLKESNLYKFIRTLVILVFIFSMTIAILAFATPVLMRNTENQRIKLYIDAKNNFDAKKYSEARLLYQQSLALDPDQPSADQIRGMITATYYGQELHEDGLQFLCNESRSKQKTDHIFLFQIQAHIRALSVKKGQEYAENIAEKFRTTCGREEFSEFWAHIPFGMMESLRRGLAQYQYPWQVSDADKTRIAQILEQKRRASLSKKVPNGDFALYFLKNFSEVIDEWPESSIHDAALMDAAQLSKGEVKYKYLKLLLDQHAKSEHYDRALNAIIETLAELGRRNEALSFAAQRTALGTDAANLAAELALAPTFKAIDQFIASGDFSSAQHLTAQVCAEQASFKLRCNKLVLFESGRSAKAIAIVAQNKNSCISAHVELMKLSKDIDSRWVSIPWIKGLRSQLESCLDTMRKAHPDDYVKSLYIIASLSRKINDYKTSIKYLTRFDEEVPDHPLKDDVVTEIGYHKLIIENDIDGAIEQFDRVKALYSDRNAYDDALWWHAKALKEKGEYLSAFALYGEITAQATSSRLQEWSRGKAAQLLRLTSLAPFKGVALRSDNENNGLFIHDIAADSPVAQILQPNDRLISVCDKRVYTLNEVLNKSDELRSDALCNIFFLRGRTLLKIFGSMADGWRSQKMPLTNEQLRQLAYGYPIG